MWELSLDEGYGIIHAAYIRAGRPVCWKFPEGRSDGSSIAGFFSDVRSRLLDTPAD